MKIFILYKIFLFILLNKYITSWRTKIKNILMNYSNNSDYQCIISSSNNNIYCDNDAKIFINNNDFLLNKKLITVSPGGFKGFYIMGILTYIKENYDMDNFIFSGASAGAWNSLFMCFKGDPFDFVYKLFDSNIKKASSILELEYLIKYKLLSFYKDDDFDLRRLFIGVTTIKKLNTATNIFSDFENLEDAINCCIASSHIPLITGGITNKYHNMFTFDGGFSKYPYLKNDNLVLHISPSMWYQINETSQNCIKKNIRTIKKFYEFFSISKNNFIELFDDGYQDAKKHKKYLDSIFVQK
jgi:hypothetical protein